MRRALFPAATPLPVMVYVPIYGMGNMIYKMCWYNKTDVTLLEILYAITSDQIANRNHYTEWELY